ncbi:PREDICTED: putative late blight resistance protein homolog R1B-16 [Nicotiana attenuata]|uniref:putative late blight resistance protein homolog R1B-16 n=1 Tax=Nicotiana attenuata TaxID=49451 RepID=UPI000905CD54|nr:PREDICTED: putative late blight resistance protein homolog R1B-16 [Nicotiana attenuata]
MAFATGLNQKANYIEMAYVAVISLVQTLKQLPQLNPPWISDEAEIIVHSLLSSLEYFQDFLKKRSQHTEKDEESEREIKSVVNEIEDVIELNINETMERKAFDETLSPLVEKIDALKRNMKQSGFATSEVQGYGEDCKQFGNGGIGKTTLAKKAFDDPEIRHRFDIHVWVTVSQEYQIRDLLLGVLSSPTNDIKEVSDNQLMDMIYKKFKGRRYLVVMDDIWSNDVWDLMTRTFPDDNNGSRIILTSRLKDLAIHADPDSIPHEISLLNLDQSWKLLHEKVFGAEHEVCPTELKDIGKQIAQKCQGLPLALLVVAGHLSKIARTRESWERVAKSVSKVVAHESDICLGVLALSYNYLPNHLKPCFLYMGVFPEDSEVNVETLINLWVSEGFLLEEFVGKDCLEDLVSRNLIMVRKRRFDGEGKTCGVHDLIRDLILREAKKEKFIQVNRTREATKSWAKKLHVCRYSFHSYIYQDDRWQSSSSVLTRTVHFFHGLETPSIQVPLLTRFKLLRVLAILSVTFQNFLLEITKLVQLRYLQFTCHDDIHWSVSALYNLQTFILGHLVEGLSPPTLPPGIWLMKNLRHLHVSDFFSFPIPSNKLQYLEGLSCLALSSCTSELFSAIPNLKKLKVIGNYLMEMMGERLSSLSCLKELEMLKFKGDGLQLSRISSKYALPISLKSLTLSHTYLPWEDMANIVTLPNLEVLKIKYHGFDGDVWRLNDEETFNQLKFLLISWTDLKQWEAGSVNFPKLQRLLLERCMNLEEIPQDFGEICTLKSIELNGCSISAAKSAEAIREEQESMGNDCLNVVIYNHR